MPFTHPTPDQTLAQTIAQTVEAQLQSYARFGVDLGLDRIEHLLQSLGNPHRQVPIIHVAGTNGKGSVCAYLSAILTAAGYRTGRYTSPHLVNWTERICIDAQSISWQDLQNSLAVVEAAIQAEEDNQPTPTQFEVITAAAWQYFADQKVDVAIVEVGLGGRLDATNVCQQPLATVIVSISRDHWQRLGDTIAEIAGEKAGILKSGVPAIAAPLPSDARAVVTAKAQTLQAPLTWIKPAQEVAKGTDREPPTLIYEGIEYPQMLLGDHQKVNSACAIAALKILRAQGWKISDRAIAQGMSQVKWPGRLQRGHWQGHPLLIDGAHNVDAAKSLRSYLDKTYPHQPITWLMGMLQTKDHLGVFRELLRAGDRLHLTAVPGHLSADPEELSAIAQKICPNLATVQTHPSLEAALIASTQPASTQPASTKSAEHKCPTVFCGSLYLIGHFYEKCQARSWANRDQSSSGVR
ncbi:MAG: bifunctional folylpolyglutamate synthase/dihydrofolate synthase [Leptolyngbya foveolarum]|uniref:Dihydrofolate synthase/folylpolyglutamate synthase n=1 Tax=Leptolyngbya foveolarum TaxID=47253 RepID=A0A2W4U3H1_9CYAN|nr:MAG: bifunctional folylpolyglutamate synthase/dihydrofolate synthase [Leptolyngbya foveolarum]